MGVRLLHFPIMAICAAAACQAAPLDRERPREVVITGGPTCNCRIERYRLATISDSLYPSGAITTSPRVHVAADGHFLVLDGGLIPDRIYLADPTGNIVQQIGAMGVDPASTGGLPESPNSRIRT